MLLLQHMRMIVSRMISKISLLDILFKSKGTISIKVDREYELNNFFVPNISSNQKIFWKLMIYYKKALSFDFINFSIFEKEYYVIIFVLI